MVDGKWAWIYTRIRLLISCTYSLPIVCQLWSIMTSAFISDLYCKLVELRLQREKRTLSFTAKVLFLYRATKWHCSKIKHGWKRNALFCVWKHCLVPSFKGIRQLFFSFVLFASLLSSRQEDTYHSFDCVCSNKEETGRAHPPLISLAQILVVNGKC